ncbi:hypothetical protein JOD45_001028 [Scopulibacillus daqui]|uniref:DUF2953 family protein n=1 Tax=Scopulibacillus daqui TaxID=1469162 RepID=A0ABS2PXP6_9BACL|nr:DUF2953 domain-containing protein [Scopulibacillus daqui]MBM7644821.1 hypothetical protein [Scopulibacillus daqui]
MVMTGLVILLIFVFLFVILWFCTYISIDLQGLISELDIDGELKIKVWGVTILKKNLEDIDLDVSPFKMVLKSDGDNDRVSVNIEEFKAGFSKMMKGVKLLGDLNQRYQLLKWFKIKHLMWRTKVGLDDAALTGISAGVIWMIKIQLIRLIDEWFVLKKRPVIDVWPVYQSFAAETEFSCMISFRLGKAIITGYRIAKYWKRRHHPACQNIQYKA